MSFLITLCVAIVFSWLPILVAIILAVRSRNSIKPSLPTKFIRIHILICLATLPLLHFIAIVWLLHPFAPLAALAYTTIPVMTMGGFSVAGLFKNSFGNVKDLFSDMKGIVDIIVFPNETLTAVKESIPKLEDVIKTWGADEIVTPYRQFFSQYQETFNFVQAINVLPSQREKKLSCDAFMNMTKTIFLEHGTPEMEDLLKEGARAVLKILETLGFSNVFHCSKNTEKADQVYKKLIDLLYKVISVANVMEMLQGNPPNPDMLAIFTDMESIPKDFYRTVDIFEIIQSSCAPKETKEIASFICQYPNEESTSYFKSRIIPKEVTGIPSLSDIWALLPEAARIIVLLQTVVAVIVAFICFALYNVVRTRAQTLVVRRYSLRFPQDSRNVKGWLFTAYLTGLCFAVVEIVPWCFILGLTYRNGVNLFTFVAPLLHCISLIPLYTATQICIIKPVAKQDGKEEIVSHRLWAYFLSAGIQTPVIICWYLSLGVMLFVKNIQYTLLILTFDFIVSVLLMIWERSISRKLSHMGLHELESGLSVTTESVPRTNEKTE